ncbi:hypothetical protein DFS34DRAFT_641736 [Phlyctochytrium arcticum]|nr:hypothetical protein DFS34DRAFT_641736 [Phlyctochytrium arcticum]
MGVQVAALTVPLTVKSPSPSALSDVKSFPPFQDWVSSFSYELSHSPVAKSLRVNGIEVADVDYFKNGKVGFVKFTVDAEWVQGGESGRTDKPVKIPGIVFARGGSVAVLVLLHAKDPRNEQDKEARVVLTVQPRLPIASLSFTELPAGMLDGESHKFAGTAAKELEEECGIQIKEDDLIDLTTLALGEDGRNPDGQSRLGHTGVYTSPGGSDEYIKLFLCRKTLPLADIARLEGFEGGLRNEGERIKLKVVRLADLWRSTRDMKALSALALYENCERKGLL